MAKWDVVEGEKKKWKEEGEVRGVEILLERFARMHRPGSAENKRTMATMERVNRTIGALAVGVRASRSGAGTSAFASAGELYLQTEETKTNPNHDLFVGFCICAPTPLLCLWASHSTSDRKQTAETGGT